MRVVSLSPALTEICLDLGALSALAGASDHCENLTESFPRVGAPKALNLEAVEALAPELILADRRDNRPEEIRQLEKKFKVTVFDVRSVDHAKIAVLQIGKPLGCSVKAAEIIAAIETEEKACRAEAELRAKVPTLILIWNQPYLTVNFDTYPSRLVETAGGVNVFREDPIPEIALDLEDMIEKNPGLLILPSDPFPFKRRHIATLRPYRVFSKIPIELVDGRLFSCYGRRTAEALRVLRGVMAKAASPIAAAL